MAETPTPAPDANAGGGTPKPEPKAELTPEQKQARLEEMRAKNAANAAAAKAAGAGAPAPVSAVKPVSPVTPVAAVEPIAAPAAEKPAGAALTPEEKQARLAAVRAKNAAIAAAKAAGKPLPADTGAPANKPAAAHLETATLPPASVAAKPAAAATAPAKPAAQGSAATKTKGAEVPLPPPPQLATRRTFFEWAFMAWAAFFVWLGGIGHMFLRFMFPNVLYESDPKFIAGTRSDFPELNKVYENFKQGQAVWLVRLAEQGQDRLVALSTVCTHLGCTPNWLEAEQKFKCPCHGSGYYKDGVNFEGPTPRPLERFRIYFDATGNIVVDKAIKFRSDLNQWGQNESYVVMS